MSMTPRPATILVADDDPMLRVIAAELLAPEGYRVLEAQDGNQALAMLAAEPVDLLVLDMLMPDKDGLEVILALRRAGSKVPILAISSGGSMDTGSLLRPASAFGADKVMPKPLRISTFVPTVREMLGCGDHRMAVGAVQEPEGAEALYPLI